MKDKEILEKINLLKSILQEANNTLNELYEKGMFIIITYNENDKTASPELDIKAAKLHIDYLKD